MLITGGRNMRSIIPMALVTVLAGTMPIATPTLAGKEMTIENESIKLTIDSRGGKISSLIFKGDANDIAVKESNSVWQGLAKERISVNGGKSALLNAELNLKKVSEQCIVAEAKLQGGLLNGIEIRKEYKLDKIEASVKITVDITLSATRQASIAIHNYLPSITVGNSKGFYYMLDEQVKYLKGGGDNILNVQNPKWFMTKNDKIGFCATFDSKEPVQLSSYLDGGCSTLDWQYAPLLEGKSLSYSYTLYPFDVTNNARNPAFLQDVLKSAASLADCAKKKENGPVANVAPLITARPVLPPKKSGFAFSGNIEQIAYVAAETPSMIHFLPINPSHKPDLILALPEGIRLLGGFRNFQFVQLGTENIEGEKYNLTRIVTGPASSKYTFIWQAENSLPASGKKNFKAYYWGEWNNQKQERQALNIELIPVPAVTSFKTIPVWLCIPSDLAAMWPDMNALKDCGFNYLDVWSYTRAGSERDSWGGKALLKTQGKCKEADINLIVWVREWWWAEAIKTKEGKAMFIDGSPADTLCLSYRGPFFQEWIEQGKYFIDNGIYFHSTDPEIYREGEKICFCPNCIFEFKNFLKKNYPELKYKNPIKFESNPKEYSELHNAWNDFKASRYAGFFAEYRHQMEEYMKEKGLNKLFKMYIMSTYHRSWDSFYGFDNYKESPVYLKTLEDPIKLSKIFNIIAPMAYMDVYANYRDYDMLSTWKDTISLRKIVGDTASIAPMLCTGYPFVPAFDCDTSAEMLKYNILESFIGGGKGFSFWGECPFDAKDMKVTAEVVGMLSPYEEIILTGTPSDNIKAISGNAFAKRLESPNGSLVLISEYSKDKISAKISCPVKNSSQVIDLTTGKEVAIISVEKPVFNIELDNERAHLFLIKPE